MQSNPVAVFWDYENCHSASQISGYEVVNGIRNVAHRFGSVKSFKAYMELPDSETTPRSLNLRSELQSSGVSLTDCPHNGRKDVADQMIIVDMMAYAMDYSAPATLILISGDRDFAYAVSILRLRKYEVVVISLGAHISLKSQASVCLDWNADVLPNAKCTEPMSVAQSPPARRSSYFGDRPSPFSGPKVDENPYPTEAASADATLAQRRTSPESVQRRPESCVPAPAYYTPQIFKRNALGAGITSAPISSTSTPPLSRPVRIDESEDNFAPPPVGDFSRPSSFLPTQAHTQPVSPHIPLSTCPPPGAVEKLDTLPSCGPQLRPDSAEENPSHNHRHFQALIDILQNYRAKGVMQPLRSNVGMQLSGLAVYKEAGAKNFSQFTALAEQAKVVQLGGKDGSAWISLHRNLL